MKPFPTLALALLATTALGQVDANRTILIVNGEEVRGSEYYHRMEYLPNVGRQMGNSFAIFPPGFLTIEQLITERLVLQLAKSKGMAPTDAELQVEMRNRLEDNPRYVEDWLLSGQTRADLEAQVRIELARFKLQTAGVTITDQEIDNFYKENSARYAIPKRYTLKVIAVTSAEAKTAVDAELASGKAFGDVAKGHSVELSKDSGGDIGTVPATELTDKVRQALEATKIGQASGWLDSDGYSVRFFVSGILPQETPPLDAKMRRRVRREMMIQRGMVKNDLRSMMNNYRSQAKIDIKSKEFADAYNKFINAYLKEKGVGSGG